MQPFVIAVAPNGARRTQTDHPALPLTAKDLVRTAHECAEAGASMMHFHVRDGNGRHSLEPDLYRKTLTILQGEIGDKMLLQVSTEAAGIYSAAQQITSMEKLAPHCLSIGLRELFRAPEDDAPGYRFLVNLQRAGALVQYILYSPQEVSWFQELCAHGIIPGNHHFLLFVLGSYARPDEVSYPLANYVNNLQRSVTWMACGFGRTEADIARQAAEFGGHVRVGFENNLLLRDGSTAPGNSDLVAQAAETGRNTGRQPGTRDDAIALH